MELVNKKDIDNIRKQFKVNNDLLKIHDILYVYIVRESNEIYHEQCLPFELLEDEQKEMFIDNFKKVLTGQIDEKIFELKFQRDAEHSSQLILHRGLLTKERNEWKREMLQLVEKLIKDKQYDSDIVVMFIRGEYYKPQKKRKDGTEESERDTVYSHPFILCSMNKTQDPKKELLFDYNEKELKYNIAVDPIINLKAPISGFFFPSISNNYSDVNHVIYSSGKANELNYHFIEEVLNAEEVMTAHEDKIVFEEIVRNVVGDKMNTSTLSNVYEEIHRVIVEHEEEEEMPTLDYKDVEKVLTSSGAEQVTAEKVEEAFKCVLDDKTYEFKAKNIVPKFTSKSIKIKTKVADIAVSPQDLRYVRQVQWNGKPCLLVELEENTIIEGFEMVPETLINKAAEE